jgi:formylglycine-generating enzyme
MTGASHSALRAGTSIGAQHEINRVLREGADSTRYEGRNNTDGRLVAVRVFHGLADDKEGRTTLLKAAHKLAQIQHLSLVPLLDYGLIEGMDLPFVVSDYLGTRTLASDLEDGGLLHPALAIKLLSPVLDAVAQMHRQELVHGGLRPENLLVAVDGDRERLCATGMALGPFKPETADLQTMRYIAPECIKAKVRVPQTDVYQMGLVLVEALIGRPVVGAENPQQCMMAHYAGKLDIPQELLDGTLAEVINKSLARETADRYATAAALRDALKAADLSEVFRVHREVIPELSTSGPVAALHKPEKIDSTELSIDDALDSVMESLGSGDDEAPLATAGPAGFFTPDSMEAMARDIDSVEVPAMSLGQMGGADTAAPDADQVASEAVKELDERASAPPPKLDGPVNHTPAIAISTLLALLILGTLGFRYFALGTAEPEGDGDILKFAEVIVPVPDGFALVQPGRVLVGSPTSEQGRSFVDEYEYPVSLTHAYFISKTEVTQAEWSTLSDSQPWEGNECGGNCPAAGVSWFDAVWYCNALSTREGLTSCYAPKDCKGTPGVDLECKAVGFSGLACDGYRLPTEAEWETAARAGTRTALHGPSDAVAWYNRTADKKLHGVGELTPNAWGLYDTAGNVYEWVWDVYALYPTGHTVGPMGPQTNVGYRSFRGGGYVSPRRYIRAAEREYNLPTYRRPYVGFRVARTALP